MTVDCRDYQKYYRKAMFSVILGLFCFSCTGNKQETNSQVKNNTPVLPVNLIYKDILIKEKSDHILIPVSISPDKNQEREGIFNRNSKKTENYYNIIFYSKSSGETSLLLNKEAIIKSFDFIEVTQEDSTQGFWIYKIIENDTNNDNMMNHKDAMIAYISDSSGKNLRKITPDNTQLINWSLIPNQEEIIIKVLEDTDKDKNFSELDRATFLKVSLSKPQIGNEIIKDELEKKIKSYIK
ncbi:MAG: hypothetical protein AAF208_07090 [Cyanobacteria bacterium P01_A01_bin.45]